MNRQTPSHRKVMAAGLTGLVLGLMPTAGTRSADADESIQAPRGQDTEHPRGQNAERPRGENAERPGGEDPVAPRGD
jgi:hypothetical protein